MHTFRQRLSEFQVPMSAVWLMTEIGESKGRQELYTQQSPQRLKALREMAIIQSVESSNRIEGVTVDPDRLRPLVLSNTRPRDRSEQEVQGYRFALQRIHAEFQQLPIHPETFQYLHRTIQEGAGDAGNWKISQNDIIEFRIGRPPRVRFRTTPPREVPASVDELCLLYQHALDQDSVPPLVAIASLIFDFLCIHPFRDGNGRISRLITVLALYKHGYEVGRYISLERLIEESKEDYYEALHASSEGWHQGKHNILPWLNYFLAIIRRAYLQFEERAGKSSSSRGAKTEMIESAINTLSGEFGIADVERACPGVSRDMVRRIFRKMQENAKIECLGKGRSAKWRKRVISRK